MASSPIEPGGTISFADAKNSLSAITAQANETGLAFTILKNNHPWVEVRPLAVTQHPADSITIEPVKRQVAIADVDELFEGYDNGFIPTEDGFAAPAGKEASSELPLR